MKAFQVFENVFRVGGPEITTGDDCYVYLVVSGQEAAVIDTGVEEDTRDLLANIEELGFSLSTIKFIILTHGHIDHIGGAFDLKERLGAKIVAHELELPAIRDGVASLTAADYYRVDYHPVEVDIALNQAVETLQVGDLKLTCVHTPGHTPGSISLYTDIASKRVLFGQDIHGPFNQAWGSDIKAWQKSMRLLLALEADILCEGHFGIYQPKEKVRAYIKRCLEANSGERM